MGGFTCDMTIYAYQQGIHETKGPVHFFGKPAFNLKLNLLDKLQQKKTPPVNDRMKTVLIQIQIAEKQIQDKMVSLLTWNMGRWCPQKSGE